jgi:hypothetical protein
VLILYFLEKTERHLLTPIDLTTVAPEII